jgi:hypothetical protein
MRPISKFKVLVLRTLRALGGLGSVVWLLFYIAAGVVSILATPIHGLAKAVLIGGLLYWAIWHYGGAAAQELEKLLRVLAELSLVGVRAVRAVRRGLYEIFSADLVGDCGRQSADAPFPR